MRILHLDSGREMRGGQFQLWLLHRGLAAAEGFEQTTLARGVLRQELACAGLSAWNLLRAAKQADLIHAHDSRSHTLAALLCPGIPLVVSRRVAFRPKTRFWDRMKYAKAERYLAVSDYVAEILCAAGIPREKIAVVHDGTPVVDRPAPPRSWSTKPTVGALDSADPGKGLRLAREACGRAGLPLLPMSDLEKDLDRIDIFLYLSDNEGLGSALLAASMRGKPIVASDIGGIPEVIRHETTGLLTTNDADSTARALMRFANDPALAAQCGEAARAQAMERFRDDIMVARTLEVYRSVLGC